MALFLAACGGSASQPDPTTVARARQGQVVFKTHCSRCHETSGETVIVGPSLAGIATRAAGRRANMDAQTYIRDSILNPTAYTVEGFGQGIMPPDIRDELTAEQFEAVVAYLLTLE